MPLLNSNCNAYAGTAPNRATASASGLAFGIAVFIGTFLLCFIFVLVLPMLWGGLIVHSTHRLEKARGSHAGADAHGHHAIALAFALHSVNQRGGADGAGSSERMAQRDGAALRIDLRGIE